MLTLGDHTVIESIVASSLATPTSSVYNDMATPTVSDCDIVETKSTSSHNKVSSVSESSQIAIPTDVTTPSIIADKELMAIQSTFRGIQLSEPNAKLLIPAYVSQVNCP